jgi:hypothetical protein
MGVRQDASGNRTTITPGAVAYGQVENWLIGAKMTSCATDANGDWVARITEADGGRGWITWNANSTTTFQKPSGVTREHTLSGETISLSDVSSIQDTRTPVLLD